MEKEFLWNSDMLIGFDPSGENAVGNAYACGGGETAVLLHIRNFP